MKAQMVRWGNSLALRIPKPAVQEARLKEGDYLEIEATEGQIRLRRMAKAKAKQPTLAQLVSQITPENRYPEIPISPEMGRERIDW